MADEFLDLIPGLKYKPKSIKASKPALVMAPVDPGLIQAEPVVAGMVRYGRDGRVLSPQHYLPGQQGYRPKRGDTWKNQCVRLKKEMLAAIEDTSRGDLREYLRSIAEQAPAKYLTILASVLPREQEVDIGVKSTMAAQLEHLDDEQLLILATATGLEIIEAEPIGETDGQTCGAEAERGAGEAGHRPDTEGLCAPDATGT